MQLEMLKMITTSVFLASLLMQFSALIEAQNYSTTIPSIEETTVKLTTAKNKEAVSTKEEITTPQSTPISNGADLAKSEEKASETTLSTFTTTKMPTATANIKKDEGTQSTTPLSNSLPAETSSIRTMKILNSTFKPWRPQNLAFAEPESDLIATTSANRPNEFGSAATASLAEERNNQMSSSMSSNKIILTPAAKARNFAVFRQTYSPFSAMIISVLLFLVVKIGQF